MGIHEATQVCLLGPETEQTDMGSELEKDEQEQAERYADVLNHADQTTIAVARLQAAIRRLTAEVDTHGDGE